MYRKKVYLVRGKLTFMNNVRYYILYNPFLFLARLFRRKSQAIVIARLSLSSLSCKTFSDAPYSKSIKGIHTKLLILVHLDKIQL